MIHQENNVIFIEEIFIKQVPMTAVIMGPGLKMILQVAHYVFCTQN